MVGSDLDLTSIRPTNGFELVLQSRKNSCASHSCPRVERLRAPMGRRPPKKLALRAWIVTCFPGRRRGAAFVSRNAGWAPPKICPRQTYAVDPSFSRLGKQMERFIWGEHRKYC